MQFRLLSTTNPLRPLFSLFRAAAIDFQRHKCTLLAAGVAYYVLLSLFPLAIFAVSLLGIAFQDDERRMDFIDDIIEALPLESIEEAEGADGAPAETRLERNLRDAMNSVSGFSVVGLVGLVGALWAASGMFGAMRNALDQAWGVKEPKRNFMRAKLVDFTMIGAIGVLFIASIAVTALLSVARNVAGLGVLTSELSIVFQVAGLAASVGLTFTALAILFRFVPDSREPEWNNVWPGALVGALGFEGLKFGFSIYLENFGNYNEVYGTLGTVVVFLFWSWVVGAIVLFAAELSAEYGRIRHREALRGPALAEGGD